MVLKLSCEGRRMKRQFVKLNKNATKPERATEHSAGYDISASETVTIQPGEIKMVSTGLAVQMEQDDVMLLIDRSSNPRKRGIVLSNSLGVIDHDYFPNEFMGMFTNITDKPVTIAKGQRIMQGVFVKYLTTDDDNANGERTGGFGSTKDIEDIKKAFEPILIMILKLPFWLERHLKWYTVDSKYDKYRNEGSGDE